MRIFQCLTNYTFNENLDNWVQWINKLTSLVKIYLFLVKCFQLSNLMYLCAFSSIYVRTLNGRMPRNVVACNEWSQPFIANRMQWISVACNEWLRPFIAFKMQGNVANAQAHKILSRVSCLYFNLTRLLHSTVARPGPSINQ